MLSTSRPSAYIKGGLADIVVPPDSSSPGFLFTRSNTVDATLAAVYLQNGQISSNVTGIMVNVNNPKIIGVFAINNNDSATFDVTFQKRLGLNSYANLHTLSLSSQRKKLEILSTPINLVLGDELACAITDGECVDVKAGLLISGTTS